MESILGNLTETDQGGIGPGSGGRVVPGRDALLRRRWQRAGGRLSSILPIKDEAGRVLFLAPTGTDITDRQRAEQRRRSFGPGRDFIGMSDGTVSHLRRERAADGVVGGRQRRLTVPQPSLVRVHGVDPRTDGGPGSVAQSDPRRRLSKDDGSLGRGARHGHPLRGRVPHPACGGRGLPLVPVSQRPGQGRPGPDRAVGRGQRRHRRPEAGRGRSCPRPTAARTSSWRPWPTNSAIRWPRSATPCKSSACRPTERPSAAGPQP